MQSASRRLHDQQNRACVHAYILHMFACMRTSPYSRQTSAESAVLPRMPQPTVPLADGTIERRSESHCKARRLFIMNACFGGLGTCGTFFPKALRRVLWQKSFSAYNAHDIYLHHALACFMHLPACTTYSTTPNIYE